MEKEQKIALVRIGVSLVLLGVALLAPLPIGVKLALYLVNYALIGGDVVLRAAKNIAKGDVFDENFLMSLATVGALCVGEWPEAVSVMLFYQAGELFQDMAVDKSRKSIAALMDIRPDHANLEKDGKIVTVKPEDVQPGDVIVIKPGERVPLDGTILEGDTTLDTAALTGESVPRDAQAGDTVSSGCVNLTGLLRVKVSSAYGESTVARILALVEESSENKAKSEKFITRFARVYTPCVVGAAALLALVPPIFLGNFHDWFLRALTFLVVSCPCALVISVPLAFFGGIGGASKKGVLVKGANHLEALSQCEIAVFDKTGTLTQGTFEVTAVHPEAISKEALVELAALAESFSDHPISASIRRACGRALNTGRVTDVENLAGEGIRAIIDGKTVCAGNGKLMDRIGVTWHECHKAGTVVHVAQGDTYMGHIVISDALKPESKAAVEALRAAGVKKIVMLTGDRKAVGDEVGAALGLDEVHAELMPADKVARVETLLTQKSAGRTLVFVGDGINDAPVLARADVGVAMGALGSDAAVEAADVVLMDDNPEKIALAVRVARRTKRVVRQNIIFALAVKALVLILSAAGLASMWAAVFADVGVSFLAILNATRLIRSE